MARRATGSALTWTKAGVAVARVTIAGKRVSLQLPHCRSEATANERAKQLAELAERMTLAKAEPEAALEGLQEVAIAPAGQTLKAACKFVDKLIGGWRPASTAPTFRAIGDQWSEQTLCAAYPEIERRSKNSVSAARSNLTKYIYPIIGDVPVDQLTLEHCDQVKRSLPAHLRNNSKRQILMPLKTLLALCVQPLRLIERSPLPERWLPKVQDTRQLQWLYPSEDAALMRCTDVPLWARVLWGFLVRNGSREEETLRMTLGHFDLTPGRETARLDSSMTKTRTARMWPLDAGTKHALRAWIAIARADAQPGDRMFVDAAGRKLSAYNGGLPELLRRHLKLAGVTRPELFTTTADSRNLVVHDLRATFATVKMANGESEAWITTRTGHESSEQLKKYRRLARTFGELQCGDFEPLCDAIPELRQASVSGLPNHESFRSNPDSIVKYGTGVQVGETTGSLILSPPAPAPVPAGSAPADTSMTLRIAELEETIRTLRAAQPSAAELARSVARAVIAELRPE